MRGGVLRVNPCVVVGVPWRDEHGSSRFQKRYATCYHWQHMTERIHDQNLHVRVTEDEMRMLRALATESGLSTSDTVRQLVRRAFAERFNEGMKRPKRR